MATHARRSPARARPGPITRTTPAFDGAYTALLLLLSAGIYLDGWSHAAFGPDQSVLSAYHLLFYTSLAAIGAWLLALVALNVRRGARGPEAVPAGYLPSLLGVLLFGLAGTLDLTGHALFGFEVDIEALLSPTHLLLFTAWALIAVGPARAAALRERGSGAPSGLPALLPALLSWGAFANVLAFAGMAFLPTVATPWMLAEHRTEIEYYGRLMGVAGVVIESALLAGTALWLLRAFRRLPAGAFLVFFGLLGLLTSVIELRLDFLPAFLATGAAAELLYRALRPGPAREPQRHLFAALLPLSFWALVYAFAAATGQDGGVWYTPYIWSGSLLEAALVGLLLSLLASGAGGEPGGARAERTLS